MNHKYKGNEPMIIHDMLVVAENRILQDPSVMCVNLARWIASLE